MPVRKCQLTFVRHIAEKPSQGLSEDISASIDKPIKPLLSSEHRWAPKIKLDHPARPQAAGSFGTVRLANETCAFICLLVQEHGELAILQGKDIVHIVAASREHQYVAYLDVFGEEFALQYL